MSEWVLVCEGPTDHRAVTRLADRAVCERIEWADGVLDTLRTWRGLGARLAITPAFGRRCIRSRGVARTCGSPTSAASARLAGAAHRRPRCDGVIASRALAEGSAYTRWDEVGDIARRRGVKVHGSYGRGGAHGPKGEYYQALKVIKLAALAAPKPAALVLVRDTDRRDRRGAYESARRAAAGMRVCVGLAHATLEAWLLNGFVALDQREETALAGATRRLGFSPVTGAHRLTAEAAKAELAALSDDSVERASLCYEVTALAELCARGGETGLADFLTEIAEHLADAL